MEKYYVYQYLDPRDNSVIYIGKGTGQRKFFHLKFAKSSNVLKDGHNKFFINTLRKILKENLEPKIEVVGTDLSEDAALKLEELLIKKHGRKLYDEGGTLLNILLGGSRGPEGLSEEHKKKISRALTGTIFSKERCENIRIAKTGKPQSSEHKRKIKNACLATCTTEEFKNKHRLATANKNKANFSKIWVIEDLLSNTVIEILNLKEWMSDQQWDQNDGQQFYRTLGKPNKYIDIAYRSHGYRLLEKRNQMII